MGNFIFGVPGIYYCLKTFALIVILIGINESTGYRKER
jgi:hypothetical protein